MTDVTKKENQERPVAEMPQQQTPKFVMDLSSRDPDINGLQIAVEAMNITTPQMRQATLDFLVSKFGLKYPVV